MDGTAATPPPLIVHVVVNLDVGGPLGKDSSSTWSLGLHNVFDENYRIHGSGFDAPGISVVFGLHLSR